MINFKFLILVLIAILILIFNGCTFFGYAIGSSLDEPIMQNLDFSRKEINLFENGMPIILYLSNKDTIDGLFLEFDTLSYDEYYSNYNQFLVEYSDSLWFPVLNDTIGFDKHIKPNKIFKGFGFGSIKTQSVVGNIHRDHFLQNIEYIYNKNGKILYCSEIKKNMKNGNLPLYLNFIVGNSIDTLKISNNQVTGGYLPSSYIGRTLGILLGLPFDFIGIVYSVRLPFQNN